MAIATWSPDGKLEGIAIKAAGLEASDTTGSAVYAGKGKFRLKTAITAIVTDTGDEIYNIKIQANSRGATTTWVDITPNMCYGAAAATGDTVTTADEWEIIVDNPNDYQVRYVSNLVGTVGTGINYTLTAYSLLSKA